MFKHLLHPPPTTHHLNHHAARAHIPEFPRRLHPHSSLFMPHCSLILATISHILAFPQCTHVQTVSYFHVHGGRHNNLPPCDHAGPRRRPTHSPSGILRLSVYTVYYSHCVPQAYILAGVLRLSLCTWRSSQLTPSVRHLGTKVPLRANTHEQQPHFLRIPLCTAPPPPPLAPEVGSAE